MLRFERTNRRTSTGVTATSGLTLLALATGLGGCSAGLGSIDLGGPSGRSFGPTGAVNRPLPSEPMLRQEGSEAPRGSGRYTWRGDQRHGPAVPGATGRGGDNSVQISGLPDPDLPLAGRAQGAEAEPAARVAPPPPPQRVGAAVPASPAQSGGDTIEVRQGDTLSGLAKRYRVSISELMRINNLTGPHIKPGQMLTLPATTTSGRRTQVAALPSTSGQPLAPAASPERDTGAPRRESAGGGAIVPPLGSPAPAAPASGPAGPAPAEAAGWHGTHTMARGDSLYGIARRHGVSLAELQRVNGITDPRKVQLGTVIRIPGPPSSSAAVPAPAPAAAPQRTAGPVPVAPLPSRPTRPEGGEAPAATSQPVQPRIINAPGSPVPPSPTAPAAPRAPTAASGSPAPTPVALPAAGPGRAQSETVPAPRQQSVAALPPAPAAAAPVRFRWPVKGRVIAGFERNPGPTQNDGINIAVPRGADVHAAEAGVVTYAGSDVGGFGNLVLIRHDGDWITAYAHNDQLLVQAGQQVRRGQVIAKAGKTGAVDQPQLHFEVRKGMTPVDPIAHLEQQ